MHIGVSSLRVLLFVKLASKKQTIKLIMVWWFAFYFDAVQDDFARMVILLRKNNILHVLAILVFLRCGVESTSPKNASEFVWKSECLSCQDDERSEHFIGLAIKIFSVRSEIHVPDFVGSCVHRFHVGRNSFLDSIGEKGEGPGEFTGIVGSYPFGKDNFLVVDVTGKVSIFSDNGEFAEMLHLPETEPIIGEAAFHDGFFIKNTINSSYSQDNNFVKIPLKEGQDTILFGDIRYYPNDPQKNEDRNFVRQFNYSSFRISDGLILAMYVFQNLIEIFDFTSCEKVLEISIPGVEDVPSRSDLTVSNNASFFGKRYFADCFIHDGRIWTLVYDPDTRKRDLIYEFDFSGKATRRIRLDREVSSIIPIERNFYALDLDYNISSFEPEAIAQGVP